MMTKEVTALLEVVNARHGPGAFRGELPAVSGEHDHLADPGSLVAYFDYAGVPHPPGTPSGPELKQLRELADAGRAVPATDPAEMVGRLEPILARYTFRLTPSGAVVPTSSGWEAFAAEAARGLVELLPDRERLRTCANQDCGWLFIDESRNQSRVWCAMGTCGSRAKMTRYRRRKRGGGTERPGAVA
jgi:hypothetical protein